METSINGAMIFDSLEPVEIVVRIGADEYLIREPSEACAAAFDDAKLRGAKFSEPDADGKQHVVAHSPDFNQARAVLIAGCLHSKNGDGWKPVGLEFARNLKKSIADPVFDAAKRLYDEAEKTAKNSASAKPTT